jgi:hypothetical protein
MLCNDSDGGESLEKPTISSQRKRQRSDEENKVEKENTNTKKSKTAVARVEPEIAAERRIWEMDTDAEEDFRAVRTKPYLMGMH